jgi:undecaprenyl-diphosphatase
MIDFIHAGILGIVEGITEFLPVSSTGHLILLNTWFSFEQSFTEIFDVVIQLGAVLAVVMVFWKKLLPLERGEGGSWAISPVFGTWKKIAVAVTPALVLGALFGGAIKDFLFNPTVVAIALIVGGVLLVISEKMSVSEKVTEVSQVGYGTAFLIGLMQCLALVPGTSRSAATIIGAMFLGVSRSAAVEFSFFLALPTMLAASAYSLFKGGASVSTHEFLVLSFGFVVSFAVAWAVIRMFLRYVQNKSLTPFGYYRIALGALVLLYL